MTIRGSLDGLFKAALNHPLEVTEAFSALTQLLSSIEALDPAERSAGGINNWVHLSELAGTGTKLSDKLASEAVVVWALRARVIACVLLMVSPNPAVRKWAAGYNAASQVLLGRYTINGGDCADQLAAITHGAAFLGRIGKDTKDLAISFIAAQVILAYFVSGFTKMFGPEWTNGTALERVMRTHSYGDPRFYQLLRRWPWLGPLLSHVTVAVETAFPLLVTNRTTRLPAVAVMGGFHLANAKFMGLGRFFLSFVGTYPAILHATGSRRG